MRAVLVAFLLICVASVPALSQTGIVAVVNGEAITSYDLSQRQALMRLSGQRGNSRQQALEELIDEAVQSQAYRAAGIRISDGEVDNAVGEIAKRARLNPSQFSQALRQSGVNIDTLKNRIRTQIGFNRLIRARFNASSAVTEPEIVAALLKDQERENTIDTYEYSLEQITIPLPDNPSPQRLARAKSRAAEYRKRFTSCREGLAMMRKTKNVVVTSFGRRAAPELTPQTREALEDVPVGRMSEPLPIPRGLAMFAVCDKKTVRSTNAAMKEIEPEMRNERGEQFSKQFTRSLRRDAVVEKR